MRVRIYWIKLLGKNKYWKTKMYGHVQSLSPPFKRFLQPLNYTCHLPPPHTHTHNTHCPRALPPMPLSHTCTPSPVCTYLKSLTVVPRICSRRCWRSSSVTPSTYLGERVRAS